MRLSFAAAVVAVSLLTAGAGCGGSDPEVPAEPPRDLLEEAVGNTRSGEVRIELSSDLRGGAVTLEGAFDLNEDGTVPLLDLDYEAEVSAFGAEGELLSTGEEAFVGFFGETYRVEPARVDAAGAELDLIADELDESFRRPAYGGVEEAGGVDAVVVGPRGGGGDVRVWVGIEDRTIRRIAGSVPLAIGATVTVDAEITDPGAEVEVDAPPGGPFQPLEDLLDRLRSL